MGKYEEALMEYMEKDNCFRLFHGKCPECGKKLWNIDEKFFSDKQCIKAKFICNCGNEFVHTVFSKKSGYRYRYPQGIVEQFDSTTSGKFKVIKQIDCVYRVTSKGVKKKLLKLEE